MISNKINDDKYLKENKAITLVALVITIIVLLILAGISISAITGKDGIVDYSLNAKNSTEVAVEKDIVKTAYITVDGKNRDVSVENMQKEINKLEENVTVMETGKSFLIKFNENNRYYEIDNTGNVEYLGTLEEKILTVQCTDSIGNILLEKEYMIIKEEYSIESLEIEGYEASVDKIEGKLKKNGSIQVLYYQIFQDDTTLIFTGLDSTGKVTINETSIVSYMVGDGSTTSGNGLLEKKIKGILKIPEYYKEKPVTVVGQYSFSSCSNINKAIIIGNNIERLQLNAFTSCSNIEEVIIGKKVSDLGTQFLKSCDNLKTVTVKSEVSGLIFNCFQWCSNFTEVKVNSDNSTYKVEDNILYSKDGRILYLVPTGRTGELIIPESVEEINTYAIAFKNLSKIVISDTVKTLGSLSLISSNQLEELIIGDSVSILGMQFIKDCENLRTVTLKSETPNFVFSQFMNCPKFVEIKVNSDNQTYKVEDNILYSKDGKILYLVPTGRTGEVIIPEGVEIIGEYAISFKNISNLVTSNSVKEIRKLAFVNSSKLEEVLIEKNISNIGENAFKNCNNLKIVIINSEIIASGIIEQNSFGKLINVAETIYISENISTIGSYIINNYSIETSDREGYVKYVKNI